jgi:ribosomal protein S18 acetylase RimI-like enzyme
VAAGAFQVRLLAPDDAGLLDRVAAEVFDAPVRPERLAAYLAEPGHLLVVALAGGVVIGQCAGVIHRHPDKCDELHVDEVGTAPAWRRRGVARAMMAELFRAAAARGCEEAWVGTEPDNDPALGFYRALGGAERPVAIFDWEHFPSRPPGA